MMCIQLSIKLIYSNVVLQISEMEQNGGDYEKSSKKFLVNLKT